MADHDLGWSEAAEDTFEMQASALQVDGHVVLHDRPCKITNMTTSVEGKHGNAKVHLTGKDIFTGETLEDAVPSTHNMQVPNIRRIPYQVWKIEDDGTLIKNTDEPIAFKVEDEEMRVRIGEKILQADSGYVTINTLSALGKMKVLDIL